MRPMKPVALNLNNKERFITLAAAKFFLPSPTYCAQKIYCAHIRNPKQAPQCGAFIFSPTS